MLSFCKYHGTGNDFILIDNRDGKTVLSDATIASLCDRRFGIGADGLMLLETAPGVDFRMVYYNADGRQSSMCGNGGRCITAFAKRLELIENEAHFTAIDGVHYASINEDGTVRLQMQNVPAKKRMGTFEFLDTGSPHVIIPVENLETLDVNAEGEKIRNHSLFAPAGANVNFVKQLPEQTLHVRTYERGVEAETLSCGTGVTAAAIAFAQTSGKHVVNIITPGGNLEVSFTLLENGNAEQVVLSGNAVFVFEGKVSFFFK